MLDFKPPKDSPALLHFIKSLLPLYMKWELHDTRIHIAEGAMERFKKLKGQRTLICPNHSNRHDPQVVFNFACKAGEFFNFVAAREVFDFDHGMNGWWLQHVGTYSVVRGAPDRESFKMTKKILSEGKKKLVLFPEGEISRQNDTLLALESGAAQLSFWALDELNKQEKKDPIYILPLALKYTFIYDIRPELMRALGQLEYTLGLNSDNKKDPVERLRLVSDKLLTTLEAEYNRKAQPGVDLNTRVDSLRRAILERVAAVVEVDLPADGKTLECVRMLRNKIDDYIFEDEKDLSDYQRKLHDEKVKPIKTLYRDLDRVVNFVCIYEGYVQENATQERFAHILERLETEVMGSEPSPKGARMVYIDVGEPINLRDYEAAYKKDKRGTLVNITDDIFKQLTTMLKKLESMRSPIFVSRNAPALRSEPVAKVSS